MKNNFKTKYILYFLFVVILSFSFTGSSSNKALAAPFDVFQCDCCGGCISSGESASVKASITGTVKSLVISTISSLQPAIELLYGEATNGILNLALPPLGLLYDSLEEIEIALSEYWENLWEKSMLPAMMQMTEQLNATLANQTRNYQSMMDASMELAVKRGYDVTALEDYRNDKSSDNAAIVSTAVGGLGRASGFSSSMRYAWQKNSNAIGMNKLNTVGAAGIASTENLRHKDYYNLFCDPDSAGGLNKCGADADPDFYDADTQISKQIYNRLTIPLNPAKDPDKKMAKTIKNIMINLTGSPYSEPMVLSVIKSPGGQENFLKRRSYLARHAAVRSIPQLIAGWRMPGSKIGQWVKALREDASVPISEISKNPSYKEIIHAVSIDRFNSGKYAMRRISGESDIEMEKLILNAFYLMQLRDYFELLERTALVLSVQTSIMTDQIKMPDILAVSNLGQ